LNIYRTEIVKSDISIKRLSSVVGIYEWSILSDNVPLIFFITTIKQNLSSGYTEMPSVAEPRVA